VSTGAYLCKIDGACYLCDTKTNPDPNKNCIPSTSCAARTQWSTTPTPSKTLNLY
jgi:hypothetical protein